MASKPVHLVTVTVILLISSMIITTPVIEKAPIIVEKSKPSSIVWSDDFEDNNYDGWTVCRGGYSAAAGVMRGTTSSFNWAHHDTSISVGTWSYDFYHMGESGMAVWFMCTEINPLEYDHPLHGYFVDFSSPSSGQMSLMLGEDSTFTPLQTITWSELFSGWVHFDIERFSNGTMRVYMDSELKLEATDTTYDSASYFYLQGFNTQGIDNITIDDSQPTGIISTTEPTTSSSSSTTTSSPPVNLQTDNALLYAIIIAVVVIIAIIALRKKGSRASSLQTQPSSISPSPADASMNMVDSQNLVLGALKSYPRVSMRELESLLKLPSDHVRRITLKLIAEGKVSGAFDRSMDEFVSVSATQIGRNLSEETGKIVTLPSCPYCAAPLSKPLGAGESINCPNCGNTLKG